ncbi:hypothetical protein [Spirosoma foliorum]|uniref:Uncharacterized protein n=1 Tax=Spirosoma foliorum TaxID=2710596 RepID=A0A7G5H2K3_9BACT|nr:hypothetical protein [Spirosoma foliorum]QMW05345.1 hypothetical protein H3H32_10870 [Spirosoma foliorum]
MALAVQYQYSFFEAYTDSVGLTPARFRLSFLREGYTGSIIELLPTDSPAALSTEDEKDDFFDPILPRSTTSH